MLALDGRGAPAGGGGAEGRRGEEVARIVADDNDDCGGGGGGRGFDRSAFTVRGAADRDCLTDCGKGGTGGRGRGGTGGASAALFDEGGARVESKVIDRALRSVNDSLRRREPAEVGEVTDGAGDGDGDLVGPGGGNANLGCEDERTVSCACRGVVSFGGGGL